LLSPSLAEVAFSSFNRFLFYYSQVKGVTARPHMITRVDASTLQHCLTIIIKSAKASGPLETVQYSEIGLLHELALPMGDFSF